MRVLIAPREFRADKSMADPVSDVQHSKAFDDRGASLNDESSSMEGDPAKCAGTVQFYLRDGC